MRIDWLLDFAAVTDHAEYQGELPLCTDETSAAYPLEICRDIRNETRHNPRIDKVYRELIIRDVVSTDSQREAELCGVDSDRCLARARSTWRELQDIAYEFNRPGVNSNDCSVSAGKGAAQLKALWQDPDFNRDEHAFYYVRVLENPSCRWSTWEAIRENTKPFDDVDLTIQERAWSSPIWYGP